KRPHLLRQVDGVAAHQGPEGAAAAAEQVGAGRAVTGAAGALLAIHFFAGAPDLGAVLHLVGAALALGELPVDAALDQVGARIEAENGIRQLDRARRLAVEAGDLQFHVTLPPRPGSAPLPRSRLSVQRLRPRRPAGGIFPASARR